MAFPNARRILKSGITLSALKLLILQASVSRPRLKGLCRLLLSPFTRNDEVVVRYSCAGRSYKVCIRIDQAGCDLFSFYELSCRSVYRLDPSFVPDCVVDGGGNIGLFTLRAGASYPAAKIVTCEPVPDNIAQIEKHLRLNQVRAQVLPVCLGGVHGTIPFYLRESLGSSFDPQKPYSGQIDVEVVTLPELLAGLADERILIKLDIEGMELEVLESFVPVEARAAVVVGELHGHKANAGRLAQIFEASGWTLRFDEINDQDSIFSAWSPAATPLLAAS